MKHFLLVYDRKAGSLLAEKVFNEEEREQALEARFIAENEYSAHVEIEIVVLSATSRDDLKKTHARYFRSAGDILAS